MRSEHARRSREARAPERGANLVEIALILPLLLFLMFGVVDMGRAFYAVISLTNAAREGARYASRNSLAGTEADVLKVVQQVQGEPAVPLAPSEITVTVEGLGRPVGDNVVVTATLTYPTLMGQFVGLQPLTLSRRAEMRIFGNQTP